MTSIINNILLIGFCGFIVLFACSSFFVESAYLFFTLGSLYSLFSIVLFKVLLSSMLGEQAKPALALVLLPLKFIILFLFCFLISQYSAALLAWSLLGMLSFIPAAFIAAIKGKGIVRA